MTTVIPGEEWRNIHDLGRHYLQHLRPDAEARATIELLRKATVTLRLVGADGQPLRGLTVRLTQQRHEFVFGCSSGRILADETEPVRRERNRLFTELFNGTHAKCY